MQQIEYRITTDYIELNQLLKVCGLAGSGGEGGALVTQGNVHVDDRQELRKRCKIRPGQDVQLGDVRITVFASDPAEVAAKAEACVEMARAKAARKKVEKTPPGVWSSVAGKAGTTGRAKSAKKTAARIAPKTGTPASVKSGKKSNVFADKAEAHRRNRKA